MRPIHVAQLDKARPVVVLTREIVRPHLNALTIAPITTVVRGLSTEVAVGPDNGLDASGVIQCDHVTTIPSAMVGRLIGYLLPEQEATLAEAIRTAFELE